MLRRRFLQLAGVGLAALAAPLALRRKGGRGKESFHVAGARFHPVPDGLAAGDRLELRREALRGETCFGVFTPAGARLGYVPRPLVPRLAAAEVRGARLAAFRPDAVPWKWYRVEVELQDRV